MFSLRGHTDSLRRRQVVYIVKGCGMYHILMVFEPNDERTVEVNDRCICGVLYSLRTSRAGRSSSITSGRGRSVHAPASWAFVIVPRVVEISVFCELWSQLLRRPPQLKTSSLRSDHCMMSTTPPNPAAVDQESSDVVPVSAATEGDDTWGNPNVPPWPDTPVEWGEYKPVCYSPIEGLCSDIMTCVMHRWWNLATPAGELRTIIVSPVWGGRMASCRLFSSTITGPSGTTSRGSW